VVLVRKAKNIAIGAEIIEKSLLVSHDLRLFCLSDELDHVALLSDALFKNEWIKKTRTWNWTTGTIRTKSAKILMVYLPRLLAAVKQGP